MVECLPVDPATWVRFPAGAGKISDNIEISDIIQLGIILNIDWCPSHCNITGNELADTEVKKAIKSGHALQIKPYTQEIYSVIKAGKAPNGKTMEKISRLKKYA